MTRSWWARRAAVASVFLLAVAVAPDARAQDDSGTMTFGGEEGEASGDDSSEGDSSEGESAEGDSSAGDEQPGETPQVSSEEGAPPEEAERAETIDTGTKTEFEDTIHVVQRKPVLEKNRVELTPRFGTSLNDAVYRSFKIGSNINYHFSERAYVGGIFEWFDFGDVLGGTTPAFDKAVDETSAAPDAPVIQWLGGIEGGFVPIYGKFSLFNVAIVYYELGASLGATALSARSLSSNIEGITFGGTGSLHGRIFLNDWMALGVEVRDVMFPVTLTGDDGSVSALGNSVTIAGGMSFYFPTTFSYDDGT